MIGLRWRRRIGGLLWWLGVGVAAVWGWAEHQAGQGMRGVGRSIAIDVAAPEDGRLASLDVDLNDRVSAGQVVGRLDDRLVAAERDELAAEVLATADSNLAGSPAALRRGRDDWRDLTTRAELAGLETQLRQLTALRADGAATQVEVDAVQQRIAWVKSRIKPVESDDKPLNEWWVVSALGRLDHVEARLASMTLTSSLDGRVEAVYRRPGEYIRAGDPVLRVRHSETREVVAWARSTAQVAPGASAVVVRADGSRLNGSVLSVGDGPTALPLHALVDPQRQEYGVVVRVMLQDGVVGPDEPVVVRL